MLPNIISQQKQVLNLLSSPNPDGFTRMQIARCLGIERASVCRRVAELKERGLLRVVKTGICPITGERASFLTCNKNIILSLPPEVKPEETGDLFGQVAYE